MCSDVAKLGDALDAVERQWIAAHSERAACEAIYCSEVGDAFDRYRKAVRDEVTKRHRKPSEYVQWIMSNKFPDDATSLRQLVDAEAQRILSCHSLRIHFDFQNRVEQRRKRWRDARRAVRPL
jgi:hypothetical protein